MLYWTNAFVITFAADNTSVFHCWSNQSLRRKSCLNHDYREVVSIWCQNCKTALQILALHVALPNICLICADWTFVVFFKTETFFTWSILNKCHHKSQFLRDCKRLQTYPFVWLSSRKRHIYPLPFTHSSFFDDRLHHLHLWTKVRYIHVCIS